MKSLMVYVFLQTCIVRNNKIDESSAASLFAAKPLETNKFFLLVFFGKKMDNLFTHEFICIKKMLFKMFKTAHNSLFS